MKRKIIDNPFGIEKARKGMSLTVVMIMICAAMSILFMIPHENVVKAAYTNLDYTTFTEVDPASQVVVANATHIDATCDSGHDAFVYKDYGVDGISGTFEYQVEAKWISASDKNAAIAFWCVSTDYDSYYDLIYVNNKKTIALEFWANGASDPYIYLVTERGDGSTESSASYACNLNTWYYFTIIRSGSSIYCKIYSNKERTTLLTNLSNSYNSNSYRYLYALNGWNIGNTGLSGDWDLQNLKTFVGETASTYTLQGLSSNYGNGMTWGGVSNANVWCNSSGVGREWPRLAMTINVSQNVTQLNFWMGDLNDTVFHVNAGNLTLYVSSDNVTYGSMGTYTNGGGNKTVNKATWPVGAGTNPFNGAGLTNKQATIYFLVKLHIPTSAPEAKYTSFSTNSFKIYIIGT